MASGTPRISSITVPHVFSLSVSFCRAHAAPADKMLMVAKIHIRLMEPPLSDRAFQETRNKNPPHLPSYPGFPWYSEMRVGHKTSESRKVQSGRVRFVVRSPSKPPLTKVIAKLESSVQQ